MPRFFVRRPPVTDLSFPSASLLPLLHRRVASCSPFRVKKKRTTNSVDKLPVFLWPGCAHHLLVPRHCATTSKGAGYHELSLPLPSKPSLPLATRATTNTITRVATKEKKLRVGFTLKANLDNIPGNDTATTHTTCASVAGEMPIRAQPDRESSTNKFARMRSV